MKKIYTLLTALCLGSVAMAQDAFWTPTTYRGAFPVTDNTPATDWTAGWSNFDPETTVYPTTITTVSADITTNTTWSGVVKLMNKVYVKNNATLTIAPGTIIRGDKLTQGTLIITRGAKIIADGTVANPIVFTSNEAVGARNEGDWGGLVILGLAKNNQPGGVANIEGIVPTTDSQFGGNFDNDYSGILRYVRVEFAGIALEPNKEINGITFGSVGNQTIVDYVQVTLSGDDSFEWFGGTVNCKKLIAYKTTDDDFDTDFGYRGMVQFGIAVKDTAYFDLSWNAPSGSSTSETFESDNDAAGSGKLPLTSAVFSNITCVGPVPLDKTYNDLASVQKNAFRRGARIRRNSRLSVVNSVFMGYRNFIMFDGDSVLIAAGVKSSSFSETSNVIRNNYIANTAACAAAGATNTGLAEVDSKNTPAALDAWLRDTKNGNKVDDANYATGAILVDPKNATAPDFRPIAASKINTLANYDAAILTKYGKFSSVNTVGNLVVTNAYPVPATDNVNVELYAVASENVAVSISDISGKVVKSLGNQSLVAGGNMITASVSELNNGLYFLNVVSNGSKTTYRFTVAK